MGLKLSIEPHLTSHISQKPKITHGRTKAEVYRGLFSPKD